ncbi:Crp/Fnr family transcriptional regulator [Alloacidobacterium sp.]|uniref:Crp/Fnr family transcriptional regulator n=1 Tax=Alloacidobacterium sp. TaxID=2951999 RepID=UPI002D261778|nr:Crp/Fnr family transcriptional regulator [Alloacidobacterium sp.]HYK37517.1 Crp/Fnr family transcriptional regulator [Alloacidobacterium sp.]
MSREQRIRVLAKSSLCQNLPETVVAELAARSVERRVKQGQILFTANEPASGMYIVLSGSIRAFRENIDGREQTIHVERAGGILAEVAVFDGGPYPSNAVADEDSDVLFLSTEDVHRFMLLHPEAALAALANMARKLRIVASLAEQLALQDVGQRLATLLLEEARLALPKLQDGVSFSLPLSHAQIASRLGSVREVVTRTLQKLVQHGVIEVRGHRIVVLNVKALVSEAQKRRHGTNTQLS